jgi:chromosome segregation ATPase
MQETLNQILFEIKDMKKDITELKQGQGRLESDVLSLKQGQERLESDVSGLKSDVSGLKTDVSGLKQGQGRLETDVSGLKTDVSGLKQGQGRLETKVDRIETKVDRLTTELRSNFKFTNDKLDEHRQVFDVVSDGLKGLKIDVEFLSSKSGVHDMEINNIKNKLK